MIDSRRFKVRINPKAASTMSTMSTQSTMSTPSTPPPGVLLINMGTPAAPTFPAVRGYLKQFLWDPRVVQALRLPRWSWWLILNGVILNTTPWRSARLYERIWTHEGSPLLVISRRQALTLEAELARRMTPPPAVALAMRYGDPSLEAGLKALRDAGCGRILIFPLYPQYSGPATGSALAAVNEFLNRWGWLPELAVIEHYHDDPAYIGALAASATEFWQREGEPERVLFSFHGLPTRCVAAGDPYPDQCRQTAQLAAEALGLEDKHWAMAYQSRSGCSAWIEPYTQAILAQWAADGVRCVDVMCPGFSADCLETLDEIARRARDHFLRAGGERLRAIPALNDRPDHIAALAALAQSHLKT
jgi:protoporphyrin/coproporphyrin ferrochelatase